MRGHLARRATALASGLFAFAAILALFATLFAPFSGWGPFAGPSPLHGCGGASGASGAADAFEGLARAYLASAAPLLIVLGMISFPLGAFALSTGAHEPNPRVVRAWVGACGLPVAIGWVLAVYLGLAPC